MQKIIFASTNVGKLTEIQLAVDQEKLPLEIVPQTLLKIPESAEPHTTFVENALQKAHHAATYTDLPVLADDSGLVVAALHGEPGVYSARYAGSDANAQRNVEKLLEKMRTVPSQKRHAYFYCVLVYLQHRADATPAIFQTRWEGQILAAPQGEQGFGYDPIFYVPAHHCSAAQLSLEIKNKISHRGQALQEFFASLKKIA